jgi:trigger factor
MLAGGERAGQQAEVAVTVRSVKERELPDLNDDFAQVASEFDTLDEVREDLAKRLTRVRRVERLYKARDSALQALLAASNVPTPEGVVRQEVASRKQSMAEQLEQMGTTLGDYLGLEGKTEAELDSEMTDAAAEGVKIQLLLDAVADREKIQVSDDEYGHEVLHRAQRARMTPQKYYDELLKAGLAATVFADVRRNKALAHLLELIAFRDSAGERLSVDALRADLALDEDESDAEHESDAEQHESGVENESGVEDESGVDSELTKAHVVSSASASAQPAS